MLNAVSRALALCLLALPAAAALKPVEPRCEYLPLPLTVESPAPRLTWRLEESDPTARGVVQSAYRILVASTAEKLAADEGDLWDSGKVVSAETVNVPYAGKALAAYQQCFWKVRVWNGAGAESPWSPAARWGMGLLAPADADAAAWISFRDPSPLHADRAKLHLPPARHYRRDFTPGKPVRRAVLYGSALGIAQYHLNGARIGDAFFEPGWADYAKRAYYVAHDVTPLLRPGANRLGAVVADGWYSGYVGYALLVGYGPNHTGRNIYGKTPALWTHLRVEYADGSVENISTGAGWEVSGDGPFREADLIMGEDFDARRDDGEWCVPGGGAGWKWEPAVDAAANGSVKAKFFEPGRETEREFGFVKPPVLQGYPGPAVRLTGLLKAVRVTEPKPGVHIYDLGQNFAGIIQLKVKGPAGTRVQIRYGEMLHPDGRLMTENLRRARATDFYTLKGEPNGEVWSPRFTYHGFQYVELTGLPEKPAADAVTGIALNSETPDAGAFACSDPVLTKFWRNTTWTQRANFLELPTDCPQRDERLGWMGDAQIYARTASYNADISAFMTKWIDDVRESQRDSGAYPDYAPYPFAHGAPGANHGTAWTDAGVIVPHVLWQVYGDTRLLERHWASLTRFMDWRAKADPGLRGVKIGNTWGDWLNLGEETPIEFIDLAYHAQSARLMAEMSAALGKDAEAAAYRQRFDTLAAHFREGYASGPGGALTIDTQTAHVLALDFGLLDPAARPKVAARLVEKITANGTRMATGFLGTKAILPVLSAHGHHDLAVRLFQSRRFPSWGYEVEQGATSVWERWDSFTKEHGFDGFTGKNNAAMNSFSHYSFGAVMEWGFRTLAGIDTDGPGFRRLVLRPGVHSLAPTEGEAVPVEWVEASYRGIRGVNALAWRQGKDGLQIDATVPPNVTATILLPAPDREPATESGKPLAEAPGVKVLGPRDGRLAVEVGSGIYRFIVK